MHDPNLEGKHFFIEATNEINEATGYWKERAGHKAIQLIRGFTWYGEPMVDYVAEFSMEETDKPLTPLNYDPKRLKNVPTKFDKNLENVKFGIPDENNQAICTGNYKELPEGKYLEIKSFTEKRFQLEKDLLKQSNKSLIEKIALEIMKQRK